MKKNEKNSQPHQIILAFGQTVLKLNCLLTIDILDSIQQSLKADEHKNGHGDKSEKSCDDQTWPQVGPIVQPKNWVTLRP